MESNNSIGQQQPILLPHRGNLILVFGILGIFIPLVFSILTWIMATKDLRQMREGGMDPSGKGITNTGMILGVIGFGLSFLSIIIIGIAIFAGVTMYDNQAYNSNQQAVAQELNIYASMIVQWWKTPATQGGAGMESANISETRVMQWLEFDKSADSILTTDSGVYKVTSVSSNALTIELQGIGKEKRSKQFPLVKTVVDLNNSSITSIVSTDNDGRF